MISWSAVLITENQADTMFSTLWTFFWSILNLLVDFRHVIIAIFFLWLVIRFFKKRRSDYSWWSEVVSAESRAVSWTWKKYWSIGWKVKSKWSIKNRFWFK